MDRRRILVWSGSALAASLAGCAGETTDAENGSTDGGATDDNATERGAEQPAPVEFSGDGDATRDGLELRGGLTVVEAVHDGSAEFIVTLEATNRDASQVFANQTGAFDGATAALLEGGEYRVDVVADGQWLLTVRQPRAASGEALPVTLEETGYVVKGPYEFSGSHTATASQEADGGFIADLFLPADGARETVFSQFGQFESESTLSADGTGWIAVQADGNWRLELD